MINKNRIDTRGRSQAAARRSAPGSVTGCALGVRDTKPGDAEFSFAVGSPVKSAVNAFAGIGMITARRLAKKNGAWNEFYDLTAGGAVFTDVPAAELLKMTVVSAR